MLSLFSESHECVCGCCNLREWQETANGKFSIELKLREIQSNVPKQVEPDLKNPKTMEQVWTFLEAEYSFKEELKSELIKVLMKFMVSKEEKTEAQQFKEMQMMWT